MAVDDRPSGCSRRALTGLGVVALGVFGCIIVMFLGLDAACYSAMTRKIPIYPEARVTMERHNFLRAFGMGETVMVLDTDDPSSEVRDWYGRTVAANYRSAQTNRDPFWFMASAQWSVTTAEDGSGAQIVLSGVCGG
ncbi:MAG: hypothetical protein BroJett038_13620 [Chloroflexota bacterium]|nr:MAG: hypothetical protein BroJett038_13620 [Chloroflexota bacterium]